jgi:hypothetical protein
VKIRRKAVIIDGQKRMRRVMSAKDIAERDLENQANTAQAIRKRALKG